ncbi:TIGR03086 family metal-binding protein [Micromonospora endophytica]|uniref:TIGR03086 family protein n=1 Tax=Micromonospora endophytica TaxID=515350 RepID=A0A2W2CPH3_9ACTN|nr:TIGR03086 family metal-binding protein [Micromonospora endophytica]PZF93588.1 TIGR03086 family protein [Micromonospora endophytica]RIW49123.1 TIGR03086 family protein [Micromonospora endophytica]BCJ59121.1 TIGR03086 family protein [Micromonospora endophytica]
MPTQTSELLATAAPRTVAVVQAITDDQLDLPTPCREYAVRDLLNHLYEVVVNFQDLAAHKTVAWADKPDHLADGWRDRFAAEIRRLVEAWSDPASEEGVSSGMGMPQSVLGGMVLLDLTVHGWDLAVATGQEYEPSPRVLPMLQDLAGQLGPQARQLGVFAEPVPVDATLPDLPRLLALTGRDPAWSPTP